LFELSIDNAADWAERHGLVDSVTDIAAEEMRGGVSSVVIALRGREIAIVLKQALSRLRVDDMWVAKTERSRTEADAMRLCRELTPRCVPRVLVYDESERIVAMELIDSARNWQVEIGEGRVHADAAAWAGMTLGRWHERTASQSRIAAAFSDYDAFEQLRLRPFHETVMTRRPELAAFIAPLLADLRTSRRCFVHGDYAPKNMLVTPSERWILDFEVAHFGNPVFDLAFFLSFVVLSAIRWPALTNELHGIGRGFLDAYVSTAGPGLALDHELLTGHTACLVLARTDGMSPAQFLDDRSRAQARSVTSAMLAGPSRGLWWT
jgi:5-methylthioribose kinase